MKRIRYGVVFFLLYFSSLVLSTRALHSATFTAVTSGSWSSAITWGGVIPPSNVLVDNIIIPAGVSVYVDDNVTINGLLSNVTVSGSLVSAPNDSLEIRLGSLSGTGDIRFGSVIIDDGALMLFRGSLTTNTLRNSALNLQLGASVIVSQRLELTNGLMLVMNGGQVTVGTNSHIVVSGGIMALNGGNVNLQSSYDILYQGNSQSTGVELEGSGLKSVIIDLNTSNTLRLSANSSLNANISIQNGSIDLNGFDLLVHGTLECSAGATIIGSSQSNLSLYATGKLRFDPTGLHLNRLTIEVGDTNTVSLQSSLVVDGTLSVVSGTFDFSNTKVQVNGDVLVTGWLKANANSDLMIATSGALSTGLRFSANGNVVHNLDLNTNGTADVTLSSNLVVAGKLSLGSGTRLDIKGQLVSINGGITGNGNFAVDGSTTLLLNSTIDPSGVLILSGNTIHSLKINVGMNSALTLGSDIAVKDSLVIESGSVQLNAHALTINGIVRCGVNGFLKADAPSSITIASAVSLTSNLRFTTGLNALKNFTVQTSSQSNVILSGTLSVTGAFVIQSGTITLDAATLEVDGQATVSGNSRFAALNNSSLTVATSAVFVGRLSFIPASSSITNLTINIPDTNEIVVSGGLSISGALQLRRGILHLDSAAVILNGGIDVTSKGSVRTTSSSSIDILGNTMVNGVLRFKEGISANTLTRLSIDVGESHAIAIEGQVSVADQLILSSGNVSIDNSTIECRGRISQSALARIVSHGSARLSLLGSARSTDALLFEAGANILGSMAIDIAAGSTIRIASDLHILDSLNLMSGTLNIGNNTLRLGQSAVLIGASENSFVQVGETGRLIQTLHAGSGTSVVFPVGIEQRFLPATIALGANAVTAEYSVGVISGVHASGLEGKILSDISPVVNATWNVHNESQTSTDIHLKLAWQSASEVNGFDHASAYLSHYVNSSWDVTASASVKNELNGMFSIQRDGISSLSPFAVFNSLNADVDVDLTSTDVALFPSPASEVVRVILPKALSGLNHLTLFNSAGQVCMQKEYTEHNATLNIQNLVNGMYTLFIQNKDVTLTRQCVICR